MIKRKRKTNKKSSPMDVFLAMLLIIGMLSGFGIVYAIDYYQDTNGNKTLLYISDSNTIHPSYEILGEATNEPHYLANSFKLHILTPNIYYQYNKTPVYQGNNSWAITGNGTTLSPSHAYIQYLIELPNFSSWLIDNVTISALIETSDDDLEFFTGIVFCDNGYYDGNKPTAERYQSVKHEDTTTFQTTYPTGWFNKTYDISLAGALTFHDLAQEKNPIGLMFEIGDKLNDGFSQITLSVKISINGEQITGYSTIDTLTIGLCGASIIGFTITIMATDQFDIGGYVKDLPKRKKNR